MGVIDQRYAGQDAGAVLDQRPNGIPVVDSLEVALSRGEATHLVIGYTPEEGLLDVPTRQVIKDAIRHGLNIDAGLHDFLSEDSHLTALAAQFGVQMRDIRKPPHRKELHVFSGKIEQVRALKIAVLGTDSAIGKRTTAWLIVQAFREQGVKAELVGTGQTAWMQGAKYSLVLDSLVNDFVAGEIEHAVWSAEQDGAEVIVIEGQGSLMNPAYPGGFEILAAARPDMVVLQHAPARKEYDGFPGYPLHSLPVQIQAIEILSNRPIVAITLNHEQLTLSEVNAYSRQYYQELNLPVYDVLLDGAGDLIPHLQAMDEVRQQGRTIPLASLKLSAPFSLS